MNAWCEHHKKSLLGYVAWHEWAAQMIKDGHTQKKCPHCNRFFFEEEMNDPNIDFTPKKKRKRKGR